MTKLTEIEALHRKLVEERRRVVEIAAGSGVLPPANLLAYLANLDGAALAVEAVIEEQPSYERHADPARSGRTPTLSVNGPETAAQ